MVIISRQEVKMVVFQVPAQMVCRRIGNRVKVPGGPATVSGNEPEKSHLAGPPAWEGSGEDDREPGDLPEKSDAVSGMNGGSGMMAKSTLITAWTLFFRSKKLREGFYVRGSLSRKGSGG